jgi:hypothetical protein
VSVPTEVPFSGFSDSPLVAVSEASCPSSPFSELSRGELDVFSAIRLLDERGGKDDLERKREGVVYTPPELARAMVRLSNPRLGDAVLEPSSGRGVFVFSLAEHFLESGESPSACARILAETLRLCELDEAALLDLSRLWGAYWESKGVMDAPSPELRGGDALFGSSDGRSFDLVLGNPPYVRLQNLAPDYRARLRTRFSSCSRGNVDLYYAFVEFSLKSAVRTCLVIPNSWMATRSGAGLRRLILPSLSHLVDFGQRLVFAPVRAYASIVLLDSRLTQADPVLLGSELESAGAFGVVRSRGDSIFSGDRWHVAPPEADGAGESGRTLGSIARIHSGIATLADGTFRIRPDRVETNGAVIFRDPLSGRDLRVPEAFAPRLVKLTKISSSSAIADSDRILFPYAGGSLVSEAELRRLAPDLLDYLDLRRGVLERRDGGATEKHEAWYAYGRKQGLSPLPSGALLGLAGMSRDGLSPFRIDASETPRFLFTSGFVLSPLPGVDVEELERALSDRRLWEWLVIHGKEWASREGCYRSYGARLLASAPLFAK